MSYRLAERVGFGTLSVPLVSVTYRFHDARNATDATDAVGHCPPLPGSRSHTGTNASGSQNLTARLLKGRSGVERRAQHRVVRRATSVGKKTLRSRPAPSFDRGPPLARTARVADVWGASAMKSSAHVAFSTGGATSGCRSRRGTHRVVRPGRSSHRAVDPMDPLGIPRLAVGAQPVIELPEPPAGIAGDGVRERRNDDGVPATGGGGEADRTPSARASPRDTPAARRRALDRFRAYGGAVAPPAPRRPVASQTASPLSVEHLSDGRVFERQVGVNPFQLRVLGLELPQSFTSATVAPPYLLRHLKAVALLMLLPEQLGHRHATLGRPSRSRRSAFR